MRSYVFVVFLIMTCLFQCNSGFGGSSINVAISDRVYRDIDKLVSLGLIKDAIYSQRPWSREEIARLTKEARRHLPEFGSAVSYNPKLNNLLLAEEIVENLEREYQEELGGASASHFHELEEASVGTSYLDSPFRALPNDNGLARIRGEINPLISYEEGRRYADGATIAIESAHWVQASKYVSIYARPRLEVFDPENGAADVSLRAQRIYLKLNVRNIEVEAGRDSLIWGQGEHGGVLASSNARNLDMIKLSNDSPFVHPGIFKFLGPSKYTFFVGNLRSDYALKNAYLYGLAASFKPASFLEIGVKHQTTVGGDGAPNVGLWQKIREAFFIRASGWPQESMDNREGFDFRVQIAPLRNAVIYGEGVFEDFGRVSFWPQFKEQMGFSTGIYFPLLAADGSDDLRLEYEHSPATYGRHSLYTSGLTLDGRLRGSEIGPDGAGVHAVWRHSFVSGSQWRTEAHYEERGNDLYRQTVTPDGGVDRVIRITDNPIEKRFRLQSSFDWKIGGQWTVRPQFGYEHVRNFNFDYGTRRNNFLGEIMLKWRPEN